MIDCQPLRAKKLIAWVGFATNGIDVLEIGRETIDPVVTAVFSYKNRTVLGNLHRSGQDKLTRALTAGSKTGEFAAVTIINDDSVIMGISHEYSAKSINGQPRGLARGAFRHLPLGFKLAVRRKTLNASGFIDHKHTAIRPYGDGPWINELPRSDPSATEYGFTSTAGDVFPITAEKQANASQAGQPYGYGLTPAALFYDS